MKKLIRSILRPLDVNLVRKSSHDQLLADVKELRAKIEILRDQELSYLIDQKFREKYFEHLPHSRSQNRQDLFVLSELSFKVNGFFVEFGATNGIDLSNTYLMESRLGWNGILAEPAKVWHPEILINRKSHIELDCVWKSTGEKLHFNEVTGGKEKSVLSTIDSFSEIDNHRNQRKSGSKYQVNTISLIDLLVKYNAPREIDYLSIDTEGSEYEILNAFDFDAFDIKIITCEHNYTPARERIYNLLTSNGYERKLEGFSLFDDWYVR